jgi:type III restriction enzyme
MRYTLKGYQQSASVDVTKALRRASQNYAADRNELWSVVLAAPTGAGKTVIAASVIETLLDGDGAVAPDPEATILWVTDDPSLNAQTQRNMTQASSTLGPSRMVTIESSFDEEVLAPGKIYFLNIQKLSRGNPLTRSNVDGRDYSLWQTIANTIEHNGEHFYVVIDEAHRGTKMTNDRPTIVARIINGQAGLNRPAPVVWGISATPENFNKAIATWGDRTSKAITVPIDEVRSSGLLKDKIVLDNPAIGQIEGDTTFIRAAVGQTLVFERAWADYAVAENEPPVVPVLVVQVNNKPSDADMSDILDAIFDAWDGLKDANVVNTFGEHVALSASGHTISYMAPQDIQDDLEVRVVLCKDAISTGWDCPRAEVLVSLRSAEEYTYIAQLIGRMVRTPLARTIAGKETLNDVHCYLPEFNKKQVDEIVNRFTEGKNDEPPVEVIVNPAIVERNPAVPEEAFELLGSLPTYVVPGRIYRTQMSRLKTLATLLAGDQIVEDAVEQTRIQLNGVLRTEREKMEADGTFQKALERVRSVKVERSYVLLSVESMDDLPEEASYDVQRDDNNVEDLFKTAKRKLPEGVATNYWNELIEHQSADEYDPTEAKAETAVLALHSHVVEAVEKAAEQQVQAWLKKHKPDIARLSDAKRSLYEPVKRETRTPELTDLVVPTSKTVSDADELWELHLLVKEDGTYPCVLKGWELKVMNIEFADSDLVGWYRNPTGGPSSLRVPYRGSRFDLSMYPDFILFHRTDDGIRPSIVDPHGYHLADASAKLKGLADYAEKHGDVFGRIDAVAEVDKELLALDMKSEAVREAISRVDDAAVKDLFVELGGKYS